MSDAHRDVKALHPFFGKRPKPDETPSAVTYTSTATTSPIEHVSTLVDVSSQITASTNVGTDRQTVASTTSGTNNISEMSYTTRVSADLLDIDPNHDRRKRRKSTPPGNTIEGTSDSEIELKRVDASSIVPAVTTDTTDQDNLLPKVNDSLTSFPDEVYAKSSFPLDIASPRHPSPLIQTSQIAIDSQNQPVVAQNVHSAACLITVPVPPPTKLLRLNLKTGTIGSPPHKALPKTSNESSGKVAKVKTGKLRQSKLVVIQYGHDEESRTRIGQQIDNRLAGILEVEPANSKPPLKVRTIPIACPSKTTHPFFLAKGGINIMPTVVEPSIDEPDSSKQSSRKPNQTFITPKSCSSTKVSVKAINGFSGPAFGNSSKILKFPGAVEPCWPSRDLMHVRDNIEHKEEIINFDFNSTNGTRKSKHVTMEAPASEDVLVIAASRLHIGDIVAELDQIHADEFVTPDKCLRIPKKHFESGSQLQKRIKRELVAPFPHPSNESQDELGGGKEVRTHPALERVYAAVQTSLSAFDRSAYETQSWIHKYAPSSAAEVLQSGREAFILREWLLALTIVAVDTGAVENRSRAASIASRRSAGKRKRKSKLDGFIIASDEEDNDMDEISEPEDDSPRGSQSLVKRTVVRASDVSRGRESGKLANAVVISGPSGCGKSASVYAVAKELGFEVFEINSSSRRSGKDVLERVGDMTRNHQVQRSKQEYTDDNQHVSDTLADDLESGRQGTMNSFFKSKLTPRNRQAKDDATSKRVPKKQKQSLILLEEVDILFEEDKQFWATVMTLIAQSKRPVIMTCNDESLLPLQALSLHAIIRLTPPPVDVAVDYILLIAAAEGHVLRRKAVKTLHEARQLDLRATLTELDYWCQTGVGDCKGGLDWFYPRWPPGSDIDNEGNTIRVVSEDTYTTGMGWLSRDFLCSWDDQEIQEEVLQEVWSGWQLDVPIQMDAASTSPLQALMSYDIFSDAMSAADLCACGRLAVGNETLLDTTLPTLSEKAREDFTLGLDLIQADELHDFGSLVQDIAFSIASRSSLRNRAESRELTAVSAIASGARESSISRHDLSIAFDPIAEPERKYVWTSPSLEPSIFDRTTTIITVDVAPYVRSIVAYDAHLQKERARLSNLLSEGGRKGKRMRTTRAALSALEGGVRSTTRPDRYFGAALNPFLVLKTGQQSWQDAVVCEIDRGGEDMQGDTQGEDDDLESS